MASVESCFARLHSATPFAGARWDPGITILAAEARKMPDEE